MSIILKTTNLCKSFSRQTVVNNISLNIEKNSVYGLLGPNGAGKSTTLKMITGILKPTSGSIEFDGHTWKRSDLNHIGALIEMPPLYENLTAFENLKVRSTLLGLTDKRIEEVLQIVRLTETGKKRAGQFSLGMKQRLGIAIALLNSPKLLILDEPTNGLDPQGIKELRDILKELAHKEGTCVVVSSHLMSEMEMMCDRVGIIANGKMIGSYTMEELISQSDSSIAEYVLEVDDPQKAMGLIMLADEGKRIDKETGAVVLSIPVEIEKKKIASVNKTLIEGGVSLYTVHRRENKKLEDVFIELTGGKEGGVQIG